MRRALMEMTEMIFRRDEVVSKTFKKSLLEVLQRILKDGARKEAPAGYLFAQTLDNQRSVTTRGKQLLERGVISSILVCRGETAHGYPGFEAWKRELLRRGVSGEAIVPLPVSGSVNTLAEAQALVCYAKLQGWRRVYITAAPFHQLRAFCTTVSVLLEEYPALCVYNAFGAPLAWSKVVRHSQGTLSARRADLIGSELTRIYRYHLNGDLVSPREILAYMERRDSTAA